MKSSFGVGVLFPNIPSELSNSSDSVDCPLRNHSKWVVGPLAIVIWPPGNSDWDFFQWFFFGFMLSFQGVTDVFFPNGWCLLQRIPLFKRSSIAHIKDVSAYGPWYCFCRFVFFVSRAFLFLKCLQIAFNFYLLQIRFPGNLRYHVLMCTLSHLMLNLCSFTFLLDSLMKAKKWIFEDSRSSHQVHSLPISLFRGHSFGNPLDHFFGAIFFPIDSRLLVEHLCQPGCCFFLDFGTPGTNNWRRWESQASCRNARRRRWGSSPKKARLGCPGVGFVACLAQVPWL